MGGIDGRGRWGEQVMGRVDGVGWKNQWEG